MFSVLSLYVSSPPIRLTFCFQFQMDYLVTKSYCCAKNILSCKQGRNDQLMIKIKKADHLAAASNTQQAGIVTNF